MSKLAIAIKDEIGRLGRKEAKAATVGLKRRLLSLERVVRAQRAELKHLTQRVTASARPTPDVGSKSGTTDGRKGPRLTARSIKSLRKRLRLTQDEFGKLTGVTHVAVYLWEAGRTRPRGASREAILRARRFSVREARRTLDEARTRGKRPAPTKRGSGARARRGSSKPRGARPASR